MSTSSEKMEGVEEEKTNNYHMDKDENVLALSAIRNNLTLVERGVSQFDSRFTLRALRSISTLRKCLSGKVIRDATLAIYSPGNIVAKSLIRIVERGSSNNVNGVPKNMDSGEDALIADVPVNQKGRTGKELIPETQVYISILIQVYLYDLKCYDVGAIFSSNLVDNIRQLNRRTLDALGAKAYFYCALFYEELLPKPPSRQSPVISIRPKLLVALRSAVLRKDQDTQATVTTLLLRNYISTSDVTQADLLVAQTEFPLTASNNQVARYLYYLGRIRAIQLSYTEAHEYLTGATRKSPTLKVAAGLYQASTKLLIVVELLMGDIPDRAIFRQPTLEYALEPYFKLVQAVRVGDLPGFLRIVSTCSATFHRDGTYTLIMRLRQNVIKTGVRMLSLSYSRLSLRDICLRLGVENEESAEYIVAKAIRDGVIEASIDHERGFMQSKQAGDVYATREPSEAFHERIRACLALHDESVKAMRFPMNQHRSELKNAQEARERERELAKEIQEGDIDEDDAAGDFEGL